MKVKIVEKEKQRGLRRENVTQRALSPSVMPSGLIIRLSCLLKEGAFADLVSAFLRPSVVDIRPV